MILAVNKLEYTYALGLRSPWKISKEKKVCEPLLHTDDGESQK